MCRAGHPSASEEADETATRAERVVRGALYGFARCVRVFQRCTDLVRASLSAVSGVVEDSDIIAANSTSQPPSFAALAPKLDLTGYGLTVLFIRQCFIALNLAGSRERPRRSGILFSVSAPNNSRSLSAQHAVVALALTVHALTHFC